MNNYIRLSFHDLPADRAELLIAALSDAGFEGFEEGEQVLNAFIPENAFDETVVSEIAVQWDAAYSKTVIEETNWNQVWESNFPPVVVNDFVAIRAGFHTPFGNEVEHEIVITPKMSFGTGHHATTWMMIAQMKDIDFSGRSVFDFGTGTGILAILAARLGAGRVVAVDCDEWSIENCRENILQNRTEGIEVIRADMAQLHEQFDIILANINRNVILDNLAVLAAQLAPGGTLLISGLLATDEAEITEAIGTHGLKTGRIMVRDNWLSMKIGR